MNIIIAPENIHSGNIYSPPNIDPYLITNTIIKKTKAHNLSTAIPAFFPCEYPTNNEEEAIPKIPNKDKYITILLTPICLLVITLYNIISKKYTKRELFYLKKHPLWMLFFHSFYLFIFYKNYNYRIYDNYTEQYGDHIRDI